MQRTRTVQLLRGELGLDVVHVGSSMRPFMAWLQRTDQTRWPHLLVLDLPAENDAPWQLEVIEALREAGMRVLILSALRARHTARRVISLGIDGIVSTADSEETFVSAVSSALAGTLAISSHAQAAIRGPIDALPLSRQDTARKYLQRVRAKLTLAGRPARTKLDLARIAWAEGYVVSDIDASVGTMIARDDETTGDGLDPCRGSRRESPLGRSSGLRKRLPRQVTRSRKSRPIRVTSGRTTTPCISRQ